MKIGKTPIVVHDSPGFYVNRILSPYINESGRLLDARDVGIKVDSTVLARVADYLERMAGARPRGVDVVVDEIRPLGR